MTTKTTFDLTVDNDKMSVRFSCGDITQIDSEMIDEIIARMEEMRIAAIPDKDGLNETIQQAGNEDNEIKNLVLLTGEPYTMAAVGDIAWTRDFFAEGWAIDEDGKMNYREHASNRMVRDGELMGKIAPPTPPETGVDVYGQIVQPPKLLDKKLAMGPGVEFNEKTREVSSTVGGMVRFTDNVIEVDNICVMDNIDLESGNIRFPGSIIVRKDVEDMAVVEASGTVEVGGSVSAAQISAVGDVSVRYGISAREKGVVKSEGKVSALFLMNADIEAEKGVSVRKEIVNCNILCRGSVEVESGRIVCGKTIALGEIVVGEAGSEGNVSTLMVAGEDYKMSEFMKAKKMDISRLVQLRHKILNKIGTMTDRLKLLSPKQREVVTELMAKADELQIQIDELRGDIKDAVMESDRNAINQIVIRKMLFPGVTLRIQGITRRITKLHKGPIIARADLAENKIIF